MPVPELLQSAGAWATVLGPIGAGSYAVWRVAVKPRVAPRLVKMRALGTRALSALDQVKEMSTALGPNGGKSLADLIKSTADLAIITDARVSGIQDQLSSCFFEAAPDGTTLRINTSYERTFGYSPADMIDKRWIRIVHPDDRTGYLTEWQACVADRRMFERVTRFVTRSRTIIKVRVTANPLIEQPPSQRVIRWLGRVELLHIEFQHAAPRDPEHLSLGPGPGEEV